MFYSENEYFNRHVYNFVYSYYRITWNTCSSYSVSIYFIDGYHILFFCIEQFKSKIYHHNLDSVESSVSFARQSNFN